MKKHFAFLGLGLIAFLASCSTGAGRDQAQAPVTPTGQASSSAANSAPTSPTAKMAVAPVPGLLQPTNPKTRLPLITTGRRDPFAAVDTPAMSLKPSSSVSSAVPRSLPPANLKPVPMSLLPPVPTSPLPTLAPPSSLTPLPPTTVRPVPPSRTATAEQIEITGAVQVGNKWTVIVREPGATTSRYVATGDYIGNGRVLVKRIRAGAGVDPIVVLQQNGVEVTKTLGTAGPLARR